MKRNHHLTDCFSGGKKNEYNNRKNEKNYGNTDVVTCDFIICITKCPDVAG